SSRSVKMRGAKARTLYRERRKRQNAPSRGPGRMNADCRSDRSPCPPFPSEKDMGPSPNGEEKDAILGPQPDIREYISDMGQAEPIPEGRRRDVPSNTAELGEFAAQFNASFRVLWLIAAGITGDAALAEDVVQEAALVAMSKMDQFQPGTSF